MPAESSEAPAQNGPLPRAEAEAERLTAAAREQGITAALIGGIAIYLRCPSASHPPLQRDYKDIDLVTTKSMAQRLTRLLESRGYTPDKRFNALNSGQRMLFWDELHARQLDVFIDEFEMCHKFDLRKRLAIDPTASALPLADLVLTKMQVVEMNLKDMKDLAALPQDQPLTRHE
ncbi:MAG: nucleotidyltransferase family protein [Chloroflexota bacterium]